MGFKLELKPFEQKDGVKYKIIQITDIALHTIQRTSTSSVAKKVHKAFKSDKSDRIYSKIEKSAVSDDRTLTLELLKMDTDFVRMIQKEEANGYKVLIALPNTGIPIAPSKDTVEFINSKNGGRIIRGLAKEKRKK